MDDTEWLDSHAQEFRDEDLFALMGMWLLTETVKLRQCSLYVDYATRYTIRYSNSSRKIEIFIFSKAPRPAMGPSSFLLNEYRAYNSAVKQVGRVEHHSLPSSAQIKNEWRYSSTPNIRLLSMDTYNFNILPFCKAGFCDQYLFTPNFDSSLQNLRFTSVLNPPPPKKKAEKLISINCYPPAIQTLRWVDTNSPSQPGSLPLRVATWWYTLIARYARGYCYATWEASVQFLVTIFYSWTMWGLTKCLQK